MSSSTEIFKVNDIVAWQDDGVYKDKIGRIVAVIPAGQAPAVALHTFLGVPLALYKQGSVGWYSALRIAGDKLKYGISNVSVYGLPRKRASYLVAVKRTARTKTQLYWPSAGLLRFDETTLDKLNFEGVLVPPLSESE